MGPGYEIARAVEQLISMGHPAQEAWEYTPRQLEAWSQLASRRKLREAGEFIANVAMGSRGEEKLVNKTIKKAREEGR